MDFYSRSPNPRVCLLREDLLIVVMIAACVLGALVLSGCSEPSAEEVTAQAEREAYDNKITFTMPLAWTFSSTQCTPKDGCKTRYYAPRPK